MEVNNLGTYILVKHSYIRITQNLRYPLHRAFGFWLVCGNSSQYLPLSNCSVLDCIKSWPTTGNRLGKLENIFTYPQWKFIWKAFTVYTFRSFSTPHLTSLRNSGKPWKHAGTTTFNAGNQLVKIQYNGTLRGGKLDCSPDLRASFRFVSYFEN